MQNIILCSLIAISPQDGTGTSIGFGPKATPAQLDEIKVLQERIFVATKDLLASKHQNFKAEIIGGVAKYSTGTKQYSQPYTIRRKTGNLRGTYQTEGPEDGGFLLEMYFQVPGEFPGPATRPQIITQVYGKLCLSQVRVGSLPYRYLIDFSYSNTFDSVLISEIQDTVLSATKNL